jgi:hypothetical protein
MNVSIFAQGLQDDIVKPFWYKGFLNLDVGAQYTTETENRDDYITTHIALSYNKRIHDNGNYGGKLGFEISDNFQYKIHFGPSLKYHILSKPSTPFIEFDLNVDIVSYKIPQYSLVHNLSTNETEWTSYPGLSSLVYFGYKFKKPSKKIGFEFKYGLGAAMEKNLYPIFNTNKTDDGGYFFVLQNYLLFGVSYYI